MEAIKELYDLLPEYKNKSIEDYLDYQNIDLLKYVCEVANWLVINVDNPDFFTSRAPAKFAFRYFESKMSEEERYEFYKMFFCYQGSFEEYQQSHSDYKILRTDFQEKYLTNEELQKTIKAFKLDVSKLWYLLLFVYDYIEDMGTNARELSQTVMQDINEFIAKLSEATEITLKKNNRKSYGTDRKKTIECISEIIKGFFKNPKNINLVSFEAKELFSFDIKERKTLAKSHKIRKFAEIFLCFLKNRKASNLKVPLNKWASKDKKLFIQRLIYTVGYHGEEYNNEFGENSNKKRMLSDLQSRYRNAKFPMVIGDYYLY